MSANGTFQNPTRTDECPLLGGSGHGVDVMRCLLLTQADITREEPA